jgi:hypothetical protein
MVFMCRQAATMPARSSSSCLWAFLLMIQRFLRIRR